MFKEEAAYVIQQRNRSKNLTPKQQLGQWLIPRLPFSKHVLGHIRTELNSILVRILNFLHPSYRRVRSQLKNKKGIKANLGCGPFGQDGWSIGLFPLRNVTLRTDCRRTLHFQTRRAKDTRRAFF